MKLYKGICIVDDDPYFRMILEKRIRLSHPELPLLFFTDATEVSESISGQFTLESPEVFLLDINLPGDSGWDILQFFEGFFQKHQQLGGRVFITSSSVFYTDIEKARTSPLISGYFSKPVDPVQLGL